MKKLLKVIGFLLAPVVLYVIYIMVSPPVSPLETTTSEDAIYEVEYSRPFKKDRIIFGSEEDGALVPFGKYWRTGANAATTFSTTKDITFGGMPLKAAKYSLYTIPGKEEWTVALNENDTNFAYFEADSTTDVLRVLAKSIKTTESVEQFTIDFSNDSISSYMNLRWDKTLVSIPLK